MEINVNFIQNMKKIKNSLEKWFWLYYFSYNNKTLREKMNEGVPTELERLFFVSSDENAVLARTFEEHRENLRNIYFSSLWAAMFD